MPAIYNRMLAEHPEHVEPLFAGYRYDLRGEDPAIPALGGRV